MPLAHTSLAVGRTNKYRAGLGFAGKFIADRCASAWRGEDHQLRLRFGDTAALAGG